MQTLQFAFVLWLRCGVDMCAHEASGDSLTSHMWSSHVKPHAKYINILLNLASGVC